LLEKEEEKTDQYTYCTIPLKSPAAFLRFSPASLKDKVSVPDIEMISGYFAKNDLALKFCFTQNLIAIKSENINKSTNTEIEVLLRKRNKKFFIESGLNLTQNKFQTSNKTLYREYLGSYMDLDSISFYYDTLNNQTIPQYYWNEVNVWDTNVSQDVKTKELIIYHLKLPLYFGFTVSQFYRFKFSIITGPVFCILLSEKNGSEHEILNNNQIMYSTGSIYAQNIKTQLIYTLSLSFEYFLTKRVILGLQPTYNYYLNDYIFENDIPKNMQTYGLKTALIVQLN